MKIRSAQSFRTWYKTHHKKISRSDSEYNENFMGTYYDVSAEKRIKGFFEMYHGHKPDVGKYLPSILKIAEDGQAIYEFLQNAVDCESDECHIFYNDSFFLAINNGKPFTNNEIVSLLNIAQSPKEDPDKIGRLGVGFKLVHRLVGQGDGTNELVNEYKGPILFSWADPRDLQCFLSNDEIDYIDDFEDGKIPVLFKILLTNFPADVDEQVKDISYRERVVFDKRELTDMRDFIGRVLSSGLADKKGLFSRGSAVFLQLGEGKRALLDKDNQDLVNGIQFSMNTLSNLSRVCINNADIKRFPLEMEQFTIDCGSEVFAHIKPEYSEYPIHISFGYSADFAQSYQLRQSPNFYKYFPMGDEINGFSFMIHCDSFSNEVNRRRLQQDHINNSLLPEIAEMLIARMDSCKSTEKFLAIYGNLLLSDIPDKQNNSWLKPILYDRLRNYLLDNIPTAGGGFANDFQKIKIKDTKINIRLEDVGLTGYDWFYWDAKYKFIPEQAMDPKKLGLEQWDIRKVVERADLDALNRWIANLSESDYRDFIRDLNGGNFWTKEAGARIRQVRLFKFSDGNFYSVQDAGKRSDLVFNMGRRTNPIVFILNELGYVTSCENISEYTRIREEFEKSHTVSENKFFDDLSLRCRTNRLTPEQKRQLVCNLLDTELWKEIDIEKLSNLSLFCDRTGRIRPIGSLLPPRVEYPQWLENYKIADNEYDQCLDPLLLGPDHIYTKIILPNQEELFASISNPEGFYKDISDYYLRDDQATQLADQRTIFINEQTGCVATNQIFFHSALAQIEHYEMLRTAIFSLTRLYIPAKGIVSLLGKVPFSLQGSALSQYEIDETAILSVDEIKAVLDLCSRTKENFFDEYIIEKEGSGFRIITKDTDAYQIRIKNSNYKFIEKYFSGIFYILPSQFDAYKDSVKGILEGESLYDEIISRLDVDEWKKELTNVLQYSSSQLKFLKKLKKLTLDVEHTYADGDWEYRTIEWACGLLTSDEERADFRAKIFITAGEEVYRLTDIAALTDKIEIGGTELNLSRIFPETFKNVNHVNTIAEKFSTLGKNLDNIFNIQGQEDFSHYYSVLLEQELERVTQDQDGRVVSNTEQLVFLLLYHKNESEIDLSDFYVSTMETEYIWALSQAFSIASYDFLAPNRILNLSQYANIEQYKDVLLGFEHDDLKFTYGALDDSGMILCEMLAEVLDEQRRTEFIGYVYSRIQEDENIGSVHWSDASAIEKILGFDPAECVYAPGNLMIEKECLPPYLIDWIGTEQEKHVLLRALGIVLSDSPLIRLRRALLERADFTESELDDISESLRENTLEWLFTNKIAIDDEQRKALFDLLCDSLDDRFVREEVYDKEVLLGNSHELCNERYKLWSSESSYRIFLHEGPLTARIMLREYGDYVFYNHQTDAVLLDEYDFFIDKNEDLLKRLFKLCEAEDIQIDTDELIDICKNVNTSQFKISEGEKDLLYAIRELDLLEDEKQTMIRNLCHHLQSPARERQLKRYDYNTGDVAEQKLKDELVRRFGAERVRWTSSKNPLNFDRKDTTDEYDFEVLYPGSQKDIMYLIDCKSTSKEKYEEDITIYWTKSEWKFLEDKKPGNYLVARMFDCNAENPQVTYLQVSCIDPEGDAEG